MDTKTDVNRFISVVLPPNSEAEEYNDEFTFAKKLVFNSHKDALTVLKKVKNSRFKVFNSYHEAVQYSFENSFNEEFLKKFENDSSFKSNDLEKDTFNNFFKSPSTPELTKFRKFIENNNYDAIKNLIQNPRYLINSCETPVILMEGPRYNCFHVACKYNKPTILKLIFDTISDKKFFKILFYKDDDEAALIRAGHLLDLYLNTSDKVLHDTPLHLACKFGSYECVEILLDCELCIKVCLNKNKKTPYDVICDRKQDDVLKEKIKLLFERCYYLPIVRTLDKEIKIGEPVQKKPTGSLVSAYAGPMELTTANNLYEKLKSPRYRSKDEIAIRLTDYSKGIERIARNHCKQLGILWKEYWPFLEKYVDIECTEGLTLLENYFFNKSTSDYISNEFDIYFSKLKISSYEETNENKLVVNENNKNEINNLIEQNDCLNHDEEVFYTAPSSPTNHIQFKYQEFHFKEDKKLYINGDKISESDIDVYIALQEAYINENEFPLITKWLNTVSEYVKTQKKYKLNDFLNSSKYNTSLNTSKLNYSLNNLSLNFSDRCDSSLVLQEKVVLKELISPLK